VGDLQGDARFGNPGAIWHEQHLHKQANLDKAGNLRRGVGSSRSGWRRSKDAVD
jgi:hypothetical protein